MVEILPGQPQRIARQPVQIAPRQPLGPAHPRNGDHALQHPGEGLPRCRTRVAHRHGAGDVGRAVQILRPAIHQQQRVGPHRPVALPRHPVVHDRPVRPGAGNGVKADVMQRIGCPPEPLQRHHDIDLAQAALGQFRVQPGQKLHHRRPVAQVGGAHPVNLRCILPRLGQAAGVVAPHHLGRQFLGHKDGGRGPVHPHPTLHPPDCRQEILDRQQTDPLRQMRRDLRPDLGRINEQDHVAVRLQNGKGLQHRVFRHIRTPDVQEPADRVRQGQHCRILPGAAQLPRQSPPLGQRAFAGHCVGMGKREPLRSRWLVRPDHIDEIPVRPQAYTASFK